MNIFVYYKRIIFKLSRLFTGPNINLLKELSYAKFKATDHNSILGILWSFINPVVMVIVLYLIFKKNFGQNIEAYPLYLLSGTICVNFFINTTNHMVKLFSANREMILNSTISREILILSDIFIPAYKFIIEIIFCLVLSVFYNVFSIKIIFLLFPLLFSYMLFSLGVSMILLLFYCFARDIEHIWMLISRLLLFITPVFYSLDKLSPSMQKILYTANPLTSFLISFRDIIMGRGNVDILNYVYSLSLGVVFLITGYLFFVRIENFAVEKA